MGLRYSHLDVNHCDTQKGHNVYTTQAVCMSLPIGYLLKGNCRPNVSTLGICSYNFTEGERKI